MRDAEGVPQHDVGVLEITFLCHQMKFKPMPRYRTGVVITGARPDPAVGRMFPQPRVEVPDRRTSRLDDLLGDGFAQIGYGDDPGRTLTEDSRKYLADLGARFVTITRSRAVPLSGMSATCAIAEDVEGVLTCWFEGRPPIAVLRPDRYLAALTTADRLNDVVAELRGILEGTP